MLHIGYLKFKRKEYSHALIRILPKIFILDMQWYGADDSDTDIDTEDDELLIMCQCDEFKGIEKGEIPSYTPLIENNVFKAFLEFQDDTMQQRAHIKEKEDQSE